LDGRITQDCADDDIVAEPQRLGRLLIPARRTYWDGAQLVRATKVGLKCSPVLHGRRGLTPWRGLSNWMRLRPWLALSIWKNTTIDTPPIIWWGRRCQRSCHRSLGLGIASSHPRRIAEAVHRRTGPNGFDANLFEPNLRERPHTMTAGTVIACQSTVRSRRRDWPASVILLITRI
jgi:hypothetical protein